MLHTGVAIHLRDGDRLVADAVRALGGGTILSIITRVELESGVHREPGNVAARRARLDLLLHAFPVVAFDEAAADRYDAIIAAVGYSRRKLLDRMIAAQALVHRATLVTANPADFADIPGLDILVW